MRKKPVLSNLNWRFKSVYAIGNTSVSLRTMIMMINDNDESNNIALFAKRAWKQSYLNSNDPM